jgi:radical SAM superfamily enzyme YgiQ (UPF0313 family)
MEQNTSRVLVINPPVTDFKLYDEWMHPLGLYYLIDLLISNGSIVSYYNCLQRARTVSGKKYHTGSFITSGMEKPSCYAAVENRKYKRYGVSSEQMCADMTDQPQPDAIFIGSMMTYWAPGVVDTIKNIRQLFPGVPVVCGGIAARLFPDYFIRNVPEAVVFGGALTGEQNGFHFPGISQVLVVPENYSLLPALKMLEKPLPHGPLLLTTGCPMRCSYCASGVLQPRFAARPLSQVLMEVAYLVEEAGVMDLAFYDDALLFSASEVLLPFLTALEKRRYNLRLHVPNGMHLKYVDETVLNAMYRCGFTTLRFGYESGSEKHRLHTGVKADRMLTRRKLRMVLRCGFEDVGVYIMGGLPGGGPQEMMEEMDFIASCGVKVKPVFLAPVPGTDLFLRYARHYPQLLTDPCWHNDTFFITRLPGWSWSAFETIRRYARQLNSGI